MRLLLPAAALLCVLTAAMPAGASARSGPVDFEMAPATRATASSGKAVVSRRLATPRRFNLVGLRWRGRAEPDIELRVRKRSGWSRWAHLDAHADHNPDRGSDERRAASSDPIWVGRARGVQYRLSRDVPGLRLHFVDLGRSGRTARASAAARRARGSAAPPFSYVSRAAWGARQCPPREGPQYGTVSAVAVHHTVSLNDYTRREGPSIVLAVCRFHRNSNGWNDVGYNALVDKYGVLYEGRAGGLDKAVVGAQAQGFNSITAGISNIGDYSNVEQSPEALSALATYIRWKLTVHGQPLTGRVRLTSAGGPASRYGTGARVTLPRIIGHRDVGATACPGAALYAQLPELRALVETGSTAVTPTLATALSATLTDDRLDYGEVVPVTGTLVGPDGAPLANEALEVQVSTEGTWRTSKRLVSGIDGSYATELKPRKRMYVRVRYLGRNGVRRSTSARLLIHLRPVITLGRVASSGRTQRALPIRGQVTPRKRTLRMVVQRRLDGAWRKLRPKVVRARRGRFATSFSAPGPGRYRYYLVAATDANTDRSATEWQTLRISG